MLAKSSNLLEGFRKVQEKTASSLTDDFKDFFDLASVIYSFFNEFQSAYERGEIDKKKYSQSLLVNSFCELAQVSGNIIFLSSTALYRNAKTEIRFMLESAIQSYYIDSNHSDSSLVTKWEILKEIEGKREYRAANLIENLRTGKRKSELQNEYKLLSKDIHASVKSSKKIYYQVREEADIPAELNKEEFLAVKESFKKLLDIFFYLYFSYFNESLQPLSKNNAIKSVIMQRDFKLMKYIINEKT